MTKRLNSKHKVDRRLKVNLWGRPKSHLTQEHILRVSMDKRDLQNHLIMEFSFRQNKN